MVHSLDACRGRPRGREHAERRRGLVAGHSRRRHRRQSGRQGGGLGAGDGQRPQSSCLGVRRDRSCVGEHQLKLAGEQRIQRESAALVWNADDADSRHGLEQLGGKVRRRSGRGRPVIEFPRPRSGHGDEFLHGLRRHRGMYDENVGRVDRKRDRREVPDGIVGRMGAQQWRDPERAAVGEQRIGIRGRTGHDLAREDAAVVDDDRLAPACGEVRPDEPRDEIVAAAGRGGDDADRLGRIVLCRCRACDAGEHGRNAQAACKSTVGHHLFLNDACGRVPLWVGTLHFLSTL